MMEVLYTEFAERLISAMKLRGYGSSRSPHGICMKSLAKFADASEQICRRYMRGEALPSYEKIIAIAEALTISPSWLLFGETTDIKSSKYLDDEILHYILMHSQALYQDKSSSSQEYADFIVGLVKDIRDIDTSKENLLKIIDLALGSISSFKQKKKAV
jgi:transcriptional regulator with XRE-family HTH domain